MIPLSRLFRPEEAAALLANHHTNAARIAQGRDPLDFRPVVWFHRPGSHQAFILTEADEDSGLAYGLRISPLLAPDLMFVELAELAALAGQHRLRRHPAFDAARTPSINRLCAIARAIHRRSGGAPERSDGACPRTGFQPDPGAPTGAPARLPESQAGGGPRPAIEGQPSSQHPALVPQHPGLGGGVRPSQRTPHQLNRENAA